MDVYTVQNHVQTRAVSPSNCTKQTQPNTTGSSSERLASHSSIDQYFIRFKPMQETSKLSPLRMNRAEAGTNPSSDKPYQKPIQPPR